MSTPDGAQPVTAAGFADRFAGLKPGEAWAMTTAERILGAWADPDHYGPRAHSRIDAAMRYPDGRIAAFEIIGADQDHGRQKDRLLGQDDFEWAVPEDVRWWWTIYVGAREDIPRLEAIYQHVMRMCEAAGAERPEDLHRLNGGTDPDVRWLVRESTSQMRGFPALPAREGDLLRQVMVVPQGRGGGVDTTLVGLRRELQALFSQPQMGKHLDKIAAVADADERHLWVSLHSSALDFSVLYALVEKDVLPTQAPPLPEGVSHLWLAPEVGRRVLVWTPSGWEQHFPYQEEPSIADA